MQFVFTFVFDIDRGYEGHGSGQGVKRTFFAKPLRATSESPIAQLVK